MRRPLLLCLLLGCTGDDTGKPPVHREDDSGGTLDSDDSATVCTFSTTLRSDGVVGEVPFTVDFEASASCGDLASATWDFGDGETGEGAAVSHTWLGSGSYTVTVTGRDEEGDESAASTPIIVEEADCPEVGDSVEVGAIENTALVEASGLADGIVNDGVLWSHNDSGDGPVLYAMDETGADLGSFRLDGAPDGDWEDLAIGLDEAGTATLYAGDIGQNGGARATSTIYAVPEPVPTGPGETLVSDWYSFDLVFPDGDALDSNTMFFDPVTGALYLAAAESDGTTGIYRAAGPFADGDLVELVRVAGFVFGEGDLADGANPSGGAFSPLGDQLAIRTPSAAWVWRRDQSSSMDETWASTPCSLDIPDDDAGEALAWSSDGTGIWSTGESLNHPIWYTELVPPENACPEGPGAYIAVDTDDYGIPFSPTFHIDETCLLTEVDTVAWDLGDGETATGRTATKTWLASGTYTVTATVTDTDGATWPASLTFDVVPASCPEPGEPVEWGDVDSDEIIEASGLAQSALEPRVLWTHNDSGDDPRLFAVRDDGEDLGQFEVKTDSRDWEDIALGWDDTRAAWTIYVGDFGDNAEARDYVTVLAVPEPTVDPDADPVDETITDFDTLTLVYPDEPHNAETLMVDPVTGDLYVVTKDIEGYSSVFRKAAPHEDGTETTLEWIADLTFGVDPLPGSTRTTAGDFSPLGDRIAIRTYSGAFLWRRDQSASIADAFAGEPCDMGAPEEPQGEALAFTRDGAGYVTLSEGANQPIWYTPLP